MTHQGFLFPSGIYVFDDPRHEDECARKLIGMLDELLPQQLIIIADRMEELGEMELATAYRAMYELKLMPLLVRGFWTWRAGINPPVTLSHQLPNLVHYYLQQLCPRIGFAWNEFRTLSDAIHAAALCFAMTMKFPKEEPPPK